MRTVTPPPAAGEVHNQTEGRRPAEGANRSLDMGSQSTPSQGGAAACRGRVQWEPVTFANENGTYIDYAPNQYDLLLAAKVDRLGTQFKEAGYLSDTTEVEVSPSAKEHYRSRARFGITRKDGQRCFVMWEHGLPDEQRVYFKQFPLATPELNLLMLCFLEDVDQIPELTESLVRVHFHCATTGDAVVTLLYDAPLSPSWESNASVLGRRLRSSIIARTREEGEQPNPRFWKPTCVVGKGFVEEQYQLADGRILRYRQPEGSFSNPNASVCVGTLNWLCSVSGCIGDAEGHDFLELYCGNGNHTVALAPCFRSVVGIELDEALVKAANENLSANGLTNARVVCMASGQYCSQVLRERKHGNKRAKQEAGRHKRDKERQLGVQESDSKGNKPLSHVTKTAAASGQEQHNSGRAQPPDRPKAPEKLLEEFEFRTVLVDPPRSGLDVVTLKFLKGRQNILYISCNPAALERDLAGLSKTHTIERFCVFDHFPYTQHAECGVFLKRRPQRSEAASQYPAKHPTSDWEPQSLFERVSEAVSSLTLGICGCGLESGN